MKAKHITLTKHDYDLFVKDESNEPVLINRIAAQEMFGDVAAFVDIDDWNTFSYSWEVTISNSIRRQVKHTARTIIEFREYPLLLDLIKRRFTCQMIDEIKELEVELVYKKELLRRVKDASALNEVLLNDFLMHFGFPQETTRMALLRILSMLSPSEMKDIDVYT